MTLNQLNNRICGFKYCKWDNQCPQIFERHLKTKLKMSSSEMKCFVKNLGLMIGDLIESNCSHWELYSMLKKIVGIIIICKAFNNDLIQYLSCLIKEYLTALETVFPNCRKPKHHFLIHYPRLTKTYGPLWKCSSMRYENKHRHGKTTSRSAICRINVCRTISIKNQLNLNYRFINNNFWQNVWQPGPSKIIKLNEVNEKIIHILPIDLKLNDSYCID